MTAKEEAYKDFKKANKGYELDDKDIFELGWEAAIIWSAENAKSEFFTDHVDQQSILKGLE